MALVDKQKVKKKGEISTAVQLQKTVDDVTKTSVKFNSQLEAASQAVTAVAVHHGDSTQHEGVCVLDLMCVHACEYQDTQHKNLLCEVLFSPHHLRMLVLNICSGLQ
jgi:hypothetical protein